MGRLAHDDTHGAAEEQGQGEERGVGCLPHVTESAPLVFGLSFGRRSQSSRGIYRPQSTVTTSCSDRALAAVIRAWFQLSLRPGHCGRKSISIY